VFQWIAFLLLHIL